MLEVGVSYIPDGRVSWAGGWEYHGLAGLGNPPKGKNRLKV